MSISEAINSLKEHGQEHLLKFADELPEDEQRQLLEQIKGIDFAQTFRIFDETKSAGAPEEGKVEPFSDIYDLAETSVEEKRDWRERGLKMIADGHAAVLLLGGGMGTRLGSSLPKGLYDINMPSHKPIFQYQAERLRKIKSLAAIHCGKEARNVSLPWYIMTSEPTHAPTVDFFEKNQYFGLPKSDIFFFQQGLMPCLSPEKKIFLASKSKVACSPDGNGGVFKALSDSGALEDMKKRGTLYVHMFSVDNVLIKIADPMFLGHCLAENVDCCNKVCVKSAPHEKVGVMCLKDGSPYVIEYSEISKEMAEMTTETGSLVYGAGNVAIHCFRREFLESVALSSLPYHIAQKAITHVSDSGEIIKPDSKNGMKLEMFLFDIFPRAKKMTCLQVPRASEFAPVKNAPGTPSDSPDTARKFMSDLNISRIIAAGGKVERKNEADLCEISPLISYEGEGLEDKVKGATVELPCSLELGKL